MVLGIGQKSILVKKDVILAIQAQKKTLKNNGNILVEQLLKKAIMKVLKLFMVKM